MISPGLPRGIGGIGGKSIAPKIFEVLYAAAGTALPFGLTGQAIALRGCQAQLAIQPVDVALGISPGDPDHGMAWVGESGPETLVMIIAPRDGVIRALWILPCGRRTRCFSCTRKVVANGDDVAAERIGGSNGDLERLTVRTFFVAVAVTPGRTHMKLPRWDGDHLRAGRTFLEAVAGLERTLLGESEGSHRPRCGGRRIRCGPVSSAQGPWPLQARQNERQDEN